MQSAPKGSNARAKRQPRPTVRHPEYHDYHAVSEEWIHRRWNELRQAHGSRAVGAATRKFPMRLHQMLECVDGTCQSTLVRWLPHGRAFVVLDKTQFGKEVLPTHFPSQTGYPSFQRQLSAYGFLRLTREDDGYYHELFLRGRPALAMLLPSPGQGRYAARQKFDPASEPDFYTMPWLPDLVHSSCDTSVASNKAPDKVPPPQAEQRHQRLGRDLPPSSQMPRPLQTKFTSLRRQTKLPDSTMIFRNNGNGVINSRGDPSSLSLIPNSQAKRLADQHCILSMPIKRSEQEHPSTDGVSPMILQCNPLLKEPTNKAENRRESPQTHLFLVSTRHHASSKCNEAMIGDRDPNAVETSSTLNEDDLDTIAPQSPRSIHIAKLADWAAFLHDVDLD